MSPPSKPSNQRSPSQPSPHAKWKVWYQDIFDRETPQSIEVEGVGLVKGLIALWKRHLTETVQPQGIEGFSRFRLWWIDKGKDVRVTGDLEGARRLREWLLASEADQEVDMKNATLHPARPDTEKLYEQPSGIQSTSLLESIATTHARLLTQGQDSGVILTIAREARSRGEFLGRLSELNDHLSQS